MIVVLTVRTHDGVELGEIRLTADGREYSYLATAEGAGVIADLRERLRETDPSVVAARNAGRAYRTERGEA